VSERECLRQEADLAAAGMLLGVSYAAAEALNWSPGVRWTLVASAALLALLGAAGWLRERRGGDRRFAELLGPGVGHAGFSDLPAARADEMFHRSGARPTVIWRDEVNMVPDGVWGAWAAVAARAALVEARRPVDQYTVTGPDGNPLADAVRAELEADARRAPFADLTDRWDRWEAELAEGWDRAQGEVAAWRA